MYKLFFKRFLDFTLTLIGLIVISPIMLILCLLVKIKLGSPVFYKQIRITKDEKPFRIMKFRTMSDARDADGNLLPDEQRFTKFGDFLRNASLDELPELFNVLKGEMSLVGPRPLYTEYLPYYTEEESLRHTVRAGITGLAQINGRNLSKWNERFSFDVKYVKELSLFNDIKILWHTFFKVANQEDIGQPSVEEELPLNLAREVMQEDKLKLVKSINAKYGKTDTYIQEIKEIGGDYAISEDNSKKNATSCTIFNSWDVQYISTCRSAIKEILDENKLTIGNKVALVPSFTCHVCVEPFVEKGYNVYPYPINRDLTINISELLEYVAKYNPSVILVHSYFGFNTLNAATECLEELKNKGVLIIEDLTHGMWGEFEHLNVQYHIGSIRKWLEIPDGAFVKGLKKDLYKLVEDTSLVDAKVKGMLEKQKHLTNNTADNEYRKIQMEAESILDSRKETYKMSELSAGLLNDLDVDVFKDIRRNNYNKLSQLLSQIPHIDLVLGECKDEEVPFMVPVYVPEQRRVLQKYLVENKIFPTIIWGRPDAIKEDLDEDAKYIYDHILCFHCDQRYGLDDMERIASTINMYYKHYTTKE